MSDQEDNLVTCYCVCRACLLVSDETYPMFVKIPQSSKTIKEMLETCSLTVTDSTKCATDKFCKDCFEKLLAAHDFIETFKRSQETLEANLLLTLEEISAEENISVDVLKIDVDEDFESNVIENDASGSEHLNYSEDESKDNLQEDGHDSESSIDEDLFSLIEQSVKLTGYVDGSNNSTEETYPVIDVKVRSDDNPYHYCPICYKPCRSIGIFKKHLTASHEDVSDINCKICSEVFNSEEDYLSHYTDTHLYQCNICFASFTNRYFIGAHMEIHSTVKTMYECPLLDCKKLCHSKQLLKIHLSIHNTEKKFACNICNESFKNTDSLRYHKKKHTGPPHLCNYCGKTFWMPGEFNIHLQMHLGVKSDCTNCGKTFKHRKAMLSHRRKSCPNRKKKVF